MRIDSEDVAWPRIISTSFISGTGFMKCMPSTLSGRLVAAPMSVIEIEEVFDARIASGRVIASSDVNSARLASALSTIASTTKSGVGQLVDAGGRRQPRQGRVAIGRGHHRLVDKPGEA